MPFWGAAVTGIILGKCGDVESEADRLGLRSSSDRDRLMGRDDGAVPRWIELLRGVAGCCCPCCCPDLDRDGSEDHGGTGGRLRLGDTASFLEGWGPCCPYDEWDGDGQSLDCCLPPSILVS